MVRTAVLVVGGGPAGATAARFLAEAGIETVLVERDFSYIKSCGGGIPSGGFREFDLPAEIVKKKIFKIVIVSPRGVRIEMDLTGGHICITERGTLDSVLRRMAYEKGASLIEGQFIGFEQDSRTTISIVRKKDNGETIRVQSDYIIASDGISCSVGRKCGLHPNQRLYTISTHVSPFSTDACEFWFGTGHAANFYSWVFPSECSASIGTGGTNPMELNRLLDNFLIRRFGSRSEFLNKHTMGRARVFPVPAWKRKPFTSGNVLFLGDAAGMVMPVTYEGIYYAMKSGQFAAMSIIEKQPGLYNKLWKDRFGNRFSIMNKFKDHFFKTDESIEKWVGIHRSSAVQELAMRLWLQKEPGSRQLFAYLKAFGSSLFT